ncbi:Aquaporin NIP1-1 [Dionaea muscipula]
MMGENNGNCEVLSLSVKDGEWVQAPHVSAPRAGVNNASSSCFNLPFLQKVIPYLICQVTGSILASGTLYLILNKNRALFLGTCSSPSGSDVQSFVVEFIITFYLMFVICGVDTDERAVKAQAGLAIGVTVLLNVMFAGPISGASMNPARSLGPAIISSHYKDIWIYIVGPMSGAVFGAWTYNLVRFTDKPLREITMSDSFLRGTAGRNNRR